MICTAAAGDAYAFQILAGRRKVVYLPNENQVNFSRMLHKV